MRVALQFLVFPIIAKLLGPEAYGTVALAAPFVFFLLLFGDLGLAPALVRAKEVTREFEVDGLLDRHRGRHYFGGYSRRGCLSYRLHCRAPPNLPDFL